jgi:hypothetical protein
VRIVDPAQPPLRCKPLQHTSQGTRVQVQGGRQIARRYAGEEADYAERQPLWAGDTKVARHALRGLFEAVHNSP